MTQVGHTLTGIAIGTLAAPRGTSLQSAVLYIACMGFLANAPDLPFRGWGHTAYHISHSLFVNLVLIGLLLIAAVAAWKSTQKAIKRRTIIAGAVAWLSHFLLDSFYNHGRGIAIFWPFSQARLAIPIPWVSAVQGSPIQLDLHTLRVCSIEFAFCFPLVLLAVGIRQLKLWLALRDQEAVGNHTTS